MTREIKFRGKRLDNGEWVTGSLLIIEDTYFIIKQVDFDFNYRTEENAFWFDCTKQEVNPKTVGQFTGLLDVNGKEIYEGDIVDFGLNAVVKYHPFLCSFILDCDNKEPHFNDSYSELGYMKKQCEKFGVVGSIHDNPELLHSNTKNIGKN